MMQVIKTPLKIYLSALALLVVFLFKGFTYLSPRLLQFVTGEFAMQISTEAENTKEKSAESFNEAKEFTGDLYAELFPSLKYPVLLAHSSPKALSITKDIYLPIITPPPRHSSI